MHQRKMFFLQLMMIAFITSIFLITSIIVISAETIEPETLETLKIREYEGKDLSSIDDFFENSINGPQYIDAENYNDVRGSRK